MASNVCKALQNNQSDFYWHAMCLAIISSRQMDLVKFYQRYLHRMTMNQLFFPCPSGMSSVISYLKSLARAKGKPRSSEILPIQSTMRRLRCLLYSLISIGELTGRPFLYHGLYLSLKKMRFDFGFVKTYYYKGCY